jgi:methyl-accepting chemotaxis protein
MTNDSLQHLGNGVQDETLTALLGQIISISKAAFTLDRDIARLADETQEQDGKLALIAGETGKSRTGSEAIGSFATELAGMTERASGIAGDGVRAQREFLSELEGLQAALKGTLEFITRLKGESDEIQRLSELIADVGEQLNVLSINAAVEAARSGHAGRGFAVIAKEMRSLYGRVDGSAAAVGKIVSGVIGGIASVSGNMETAGTSLAESRAHAEDIGARLGGLDELNAELSRKAREIARHAAEQMEINRRIDALASDIGASGSEIRGLTDVSRDNARSVHSAVDKALMSLGGKRFPWHERAERAILSLADRLAAPGTGEATLSRAFAEYPWFELFYVMDGRGIQTSENVGNPAYAFSAASSRARGSDRSDKPYFRKAIAAAGSCVISDIYVSSATDSLCATVSVSLRGANGIAVLAGDVNLDGMLSVAP